MACNDLRYPFLPLPPLCTSLNRLSPIHEPGIMPSPSSSPYIRGGGRNPHLLWDVGGRHGHRSGHDIDWLYPRAIAMLRLAPRHPRCIEECQAQSSPHVLRHVIPWELPCRIAVRHECFNGQLWHCVQALEALPQHPQPLHCWPHNRAVPEGVRQRLHAPCRPTAWALTTW